MRFRTTLAAVALASAFPSARADDSAAAPAAGFDPEISLIVQGQAKRMKDIDERAISGYWPAGHDHGAEKRGLSIDHAELVLSANVASSFRGVARLAVTREGEVEVEEASLSTLGLGHGLALRGGRFLSDLGYLNAQHPHEWDFADAPLMHKALFGSHGYRQDGLQIKWVAPTDLFLQLGAEIGRGDAFPGADRNGRGAGVLFAKLGDDIGTSHAWQAGLSFLSTRAKAREGDFEDIAANEVQGLFSGRSRTAVADFVWKWAPDGDARDRSLKLQAEAFRRTEKGDLACDDEAGVSATCAATQLGRVSARQSGGYAQAVWQFMPRWRAGFRHDRLGKGGKSFDATTVLAALDPGSAWFSGHRPRRDSVMLDWSPSESSRLRLQFARDRAMKGVTDNQVTLQYILSLGAHGAHRF